MAARISTSLAQIGDTGNVRAGLRSVFEQGEGRAGQPRPLVQRERLRPAAWVDPGGLQQRLGQPFVVENRPGAATALAAEIVANSPPDGHPLMMVTVTTMA
ncbi:MAG: hypothetical protein JNM70_06315, partial [Anaerolineae bacterium]|nr:hypothetical protein [Anaerolineae bacterium]